MKQVIFFLTRTLFSLFFIVSGVLKLLAWQETAHALNVTFSYIRETFFSWNSCDFFVSNVSLFLGGSLLLEIGGALLILTGIKIRMGAFFLLLFMIPLTLSLLFFWWDHGEEKGQQLLDFFKNLSLIGALLYFLINPHPPLTSK